MRSTIFLSATSESSYDYICKIIYPDEGMVINPVGIYTPIVHMDEGRMTTVNPLAAKATAQIQYGITVLGTDDAQSIQDTTDGCASCFKINQNTGTAMSL